MASLRDPLPDGQGSVNRAFYWQNRTPTVREGILRQHTHDSFYAVTALVLRPCDFYLLCSLQDPLTIVRD